MLGSNSPGAEVQSNAVAKITGSSGNQISHAIGGNSYLQTRLNSGGVLDLNGQNQTLDMISLTNGVLRSSLAATLCTLTINITTGAATNAVILTASNNVFDVRDAAAELDVAGQVTGTGSLMKTGLGIVNLFGTNSYTGDTTVSNGTLVLNFPFLAPTSTITVNTNATLGTNGVLTLNFAESETNTVAALVLGGVSKPAGVYNAATDPLYIAGLGSLQVVPPVTINPLAGPIQFSLSGSTLSLSWPTNLGWILQSQTDALTTGLTVSSNSWFDVSGSGSVTSTNIIINPANPAMFFRLHRPF